MRIIKIEIQDFRGFYGNHVIELAGVGERGQKNLLIYGENGSGKSSLLLALKYLLESSLENIDFSLHQNIFRSSENSGYVEISLRERTNTPITLYRWSTVATTVENKKYLEKAKFYLQNHDHKAAAVYLRTAFESKIKWFCEKKDIPVKYREDPKKLTTDDFWLPIKNAKNPDKTPKYVDVQLAWDIELYRSLIMNPLSHSRITTTPAQEIQKAIDTIERLEQVLDEIVNPPPAT
ncbi:MAG: AAA family ATPase [Symploca sp. SIO3E6]|nr:AAA family ATPase [Caldora sp. SIO3E6]